MSTAVVCTMKCAVFTSEEEYICVLFEKLGHHHTVASKGIHIP